MYLICQSGRMKCETLVISKHKGEIEKAQYYANLANENVNMKESGLNNHKTLGLVKERDVELDRLVGKF